MGIPAPYGDTHWDWTGPEYVVDVDLNPDEVADYEDQVYEPVSDKPYLDFYWHVASGVTESAEDLVKFYDRNVWWMRDKEDKIEAANRLVTRINMLDKMVRKAKHAYGDNTSHKILQDRVHEEVNKDLRKIDWSKREPEVVKILQQSPVWYGPGLRAYRRRAITGKK